MSTLSLPSRSSSFLRRSSSSRKTTKKPRRKRCPNGTRRNLKNNKCEPKKRRLRSNSKRTRRCPNGSRRRPPKTGSCVKNKK